jgi:hypothetical protein
VISFRFNALILLSFLFSDGQTGSGKTYTMFGGDDDIRGIIPRSVEYLFTSLLKKSKDTEIATVCSFLEIYNDQIRDLGKAYLVAMGVETSNSTALYEKTSDIFESLAGKRGNPYFGPVFHKSSKTEAGIAKRPGLKEVQDEYNAMNYEIREDADGNVFVKDLSLVPVTTIEEAMSLISMGLRVRATHETKMNATSSRSHTVFTITVLQRNKLSGQAITGMINLVDLAGSERLKKSESQGIRLKEALHINTSLTALGKVIMALDPSTESTHIPYRDSKLTRILQNSLGGNSYTSVVANIHPHPTYFEECLSTLQFANRCRNVRNNPRVNYVEDTEDKDRRIKRLLEEITTLRSRIATLETNHGEGGGAAGGGSGSIGGGMGKISNAKMVSILGKMGIHAMLAADGTIQVNGRSVKVEDLGLGGGGSLVSTEDGGGNMSLESADPAFAKQLKRMKNEEKLKEQVNGLMDSNDKLSAKCSSQKQTIEQQAEKIKELSDDALRLNAEIMHKVIEYNELRSDKDKEIIDIKYLNEQRSQAMTKELTDHQVAITADQGRVIAGAGSTFQHYTDLLNRSNNEKESIERGFRRQFERHLHHLEEVRNEERTNVKKQYDHWLQEKDQALADYVEKFNKYRAKKGEQLKMCEKELIGMYEYTETIDRILDEVERGTFRVKQNQGQTGKATTGMMGNLTSNNTNNNIDGGETNNNSARDVVGQICLPRGLRPSNPFFNNSTGFSLTRNLISRHRERIAKANAVKEEAFYHSMHNAALETASQLTGLDTSLEQQLNEFIAPPPARESPSHAHNNSTRPKSGMFGKTQPAVPALTTGARPNSAGRLRLRTQTATGGATTKAPFLNTTNHVNMLTTNNNTNNGSQSVVSGNTVSRPTSPETVQGMSTASMLSLSRREQAQKTVDDLQLNSEMSAELQRIRQELSKLQQQRHYEKVRSLVVVVYLSHG